MSATADCRAGSTQYLPYPTMYPKKEISLTPNLIFVGENLTLYLIARASTSLVLLYSSSSVLFPISKLSCTEMTKSPRSPNIDLAIWARVPLAGCTSIGKKLGTNVPGGVLIASSLEVFSLKGT